MSQRIWEPCLQMRLETLLAERTCWLVFEIPFTVLMYSSFIYGLSKVLTSLKSLL